MMKRTRSTAAGVLLATTLGCGGGRSTSPGPNPTPTPVPQPTPSPTAVPNNLQADTYCVPPPPPTYSLRLKVHLDFGYKKVLDSRALVGPSAEYCSSIGYPGDICVVRNENDPQAVTCNNLAVGKARDTGRYGPTWYYNDKPCRGIGEGGNDPGCRNHETNQFLVYAFGSGDFGACTDKENCQAFHID